MAPISVRERGYPHPELLAETDWLEQNLNAPRVRIIDARPADQDAAGHIPGAAHLEWTELLVPASKTLRPAGELRELLESRGITPESDVLSY